jgi:hypothetical protein
MVGVEQLKSHAGSLQPEMEHLVREYGRVLEDNRSSIRDSSLLPASPEKIGEVLLVALSQTRDSRQREALRIALLELGSFLKLSTDQRRAINDFKKSELATDPNELLELAQRIAVSGDIYETLQKIVVERQAELMKILHRYERKIGNGDH